MLKKIISNVGYLVIMLGLGFAIYYYILSPKTAFNNISANYSKLSTKLLFASNLSNQNGNSQDLSQYKGKIIVLNFWATWCPPCRKEMPAFESYYQKHRLQGLRIIAISLDDSADVAKVREVMRDFAFEAALEGETQHKGYGRIWRMPLTFVIDRNGILRKDGWYGAVGIDQPLLEKIVTPLLEEK